MTFRDEERINEKRQFEESQQNKAREQVVSSIYDGPMMINETECCFKERKIEDLPCSIYMPDVFELLTAEQMRLVSPGGNLPKYIYGNDNLLFNISVNTTESPMPKSYIPQLLNMSDKVIESLIPQARIVKRYSLGNEDFPIGAVEFLSVGLIEKMYNLMLLGSVNDKLLIVNIYTIKPQKESLYPILREMAESLRSTEEDKDV